jgi:hypothetical protein
MAHRVLVRIGRLVYACRSPRVVQTALGVPPESDSVLDLVARADRAPITSCERQGRLPVAVARPLRRPARRRSRTAGLAVPVAKLACHGRPRVRRAAAISGLALMFAVGGGGTALAANTVNTTFHVPAQVTINPCFPGDVVNLSGDIHVVQTATADGAGGFHMTSGLNSLLSGASITTGTGYVNQENREQEWYARAPFPTVHTQTYDWDLISKSGTDNYVLHMQMHETVTAMGVPAAAVDHFSMDCKG